MVNDVPPDLAVALNAAGLSAFFTDCTPAHRREYLKWIGEAKRAETGMDRIGKTMKMLADKRAAEKARGKKRT